MEFCWFLRSLTFLVRSLGRFFGRDVFLCLQRSQVAAFFEKLAYFLAFVVEVGVFTTEASQSKKLRECNDIFYVLWMERTNVANSYEICWFVVYAGG